MTTLVHSPETHRHDVRLAIKAGRILRGWEQSDMADLMRAATQDDGWKTERITNIETLRRKVSPEELRLFAEIQGYAMDFYNYGPALNPRGTLRELDGAKGLSLKTDNHNKWSEWALMLKSDHLARDLDDYSFDHTGRLVHKSWLVTDLQDERLPIFEAA